jgi:hypothetical protein
MGTTRRASAGGAARPPRDQRHCVRASADAAGCWVQRAPSRSSVTPWPCLSTTSFGCCPNGVDGWFRGRCRVVATRGRRVWLCLLWPDGTGRDGSEGLAARRPAMTRPANRHGISQNVASSWPKAWKARATAKPSTQGPWQTNTRAPAPRPPLRRNRRWPGRQGWPSRAAKAGRWNAEGSNAEVREEGDGPAVPLLYHGKYHSSEASDCRRADNHRRRE